MRIRLLLGVPFAALLVAAACGSDGGGGPPTGSGGSGGSEPDADDDEIPPSPGTCRPLCCSSADCNGESCNAFDSGYGTLGVCSGAGWGSDGGGDPDGGPGGTFPDTCWTLNDASCNPMTNEGCAAGDACDFGGDDDPEFEPVVGCFGGDNTQGPGETCDAALGPFCIPGFHCVAN